MNRAELPHAIAQVWTRTTTGFAESPWFVLGAAAILVVSYYPKLGGRLARRRVFSSVALAVVIGLALAHAWSLCWASDDAYISFRYARNFARGDGLVFNPGERVEGYTDFLWTLVMALPLKVGLDPGHFAIFLSLASYVLMLWLTARLATRLVPEQPVLVGLAPLLLAANYTVASFATAGLETVFAATLALLAVERAEARKYVAAGFASMGAMLSHPDHVIFAAVLGGVLLAGKDTRKGVIPYVAPFVLVFVPYFVWRWAYYGDLLPNTAYAKSADKAYFEQGLVYVAVTLTSGGLLAALPLAGFGAWFTRRTVAARFVLVAVPLFVFYVAKIGGDFMLGRLFTPILAFTFLFADIGLRGLLASERGIAAVALGVVAAAAAVPMKVVRPGELFFGIADERTFTEIIDFRKMSVRAFGYDIGNALHANFTEHGLMPRVGLFSIGMSGYYSDLPVFDLRGLTSRSVAHLPIHGRGRPGHEKVASIGHLVSEQVELSEMPFYPPPYDGLSVVRFGGFTLGVRAEDPALVSRLPRTVHLPRFSDHLDRVTPLLVHQSPDRLACDLWHMKEYYFSKNDDPARKSAVTDAAVAADPSLDGVREFLLGGAPSEGAGWKRLRAFSFDAGEPPWDAQGGATAFFDGPALPEQDLPFGQQGRFVDTFTTAEKDALTGTLTSPDFVVDGDVLTFRIGGGLDRNNLTLTLLVDGMPVRAATGCFSEWMDARAWDVRAFQGLHARLVIADATSNGWGHLTVDEIALWKAP